MFVSGRIIALLTFPGVILHEIGHVIFCKLFNVKVHKVCYFRFGKPAGYVIHDKPQNFKQSFFISVGPFIVNNIFAILAFLFAPSIIGPTVNTQGLEGLFAWLGVALAMNSFPSKEDAKALWASTKQHSTNENRVKYIGYPFAALMYVANLLAFLWFDLLWAVLVYGTVDTIIHKF